MRPQILLPLLAFSLLVAGCGEDKSPEVGEPSDEGGLGSEDGPLPGDPPEKLTNAGLGKGDFALIEAELRCVEANFEGEKLKQASAAVHENWTASPDWVKGVRAHLKAEKEFADKIQSTIDKHAAKVCPEGKPTAKFLDDLGMDAPKPATEGADATEGAAKAAEETP